LILLPGKRAAQLLQLRLWKSGPIIDRWMAHRRSAPADHRVALAAPHAVEHAGEFSEPENFGT